MVIYQFVAYCTSFKNVQRCTQGFANYLQQKGKKGTSIIVGYDKRFHSDYFALSAADKLSKEGIDAEVIDPITLVPLDEVAIIESVKKTGRVIIVHESWKRAGSGAEIAAIIAERAFDYLEHPIQRVAAENVPIPFSPILEEFVLPSEDKIISAAKSIF